MLKVTNCELNASTAKAIAKRVMKDKDLRIAERFVPAESNYLVPLNDSSRLRIHLSDNNLVCLRESKVADRYFITGLNEVSGSFDKVQKAFYDLVKDINKLIRK
ncbi:MAG: hypothetical protein K2F57_00420 [Candidatus Gastranaerophilales bacterium]|nr:hypothetical protein [Candidatus Gastranaerophilales bacterium]